MSIYKEAYEKHRNLKLAAEELKVKWQWLYTQLQREGVSVSGDKLRYGSDRDKLGALAEAEFMKLVPKAVEKNRSEWQASYDFDVGQCKVDVKSSMPRIISKKSVAKSWTFSFKKQSMICDFICCFCMNDGREVQHILLIPKEFFQGLQTVTVACSGASKWLDYSVAPEDLAPFFDLFNSGAAAESTTK